MLSSSSALCMLPCYAITGGDQTDAHNYCADKTCSGSNIPLTFAIARPNLRFEKCGRRKQCNLYHKTTQNGYFVSFDSVEGSLPMLSDGSQPISDGDLVVRDGMFDNMLDGADYIDILVQSLHNAARIFDLAIRQRGSTSKGFWFFKFWSSGAVNAAAKHVSYQAAVYSLLLAASQISQKDDGRDTVVNVFVYGSLSGLSSLLENLIRDNFSMEQSDAHEWFWAEQVAEVVTAFHSHFERFMNASRIYERIKDEKSVCDIILMLLCLTCFLAVTRLGEELTSCPEFFSAVPDITGRLMDMLVDFISIQHVYVYMKDIGLHREFLQHFGQRAAACSVENGCKVDELVFWVDLVQEQLKKVVKEEKILLKLMTNENMEVLERDLALFGFFIALGRSTQSYLSGNKFNLPDHHIEGLVSHFIGGIILYYPELSPLSTFQLYSEAVCEELAWLPFYSADMDVLKQSPVHKNGRATFDDRDTMQVLEICANWVHIFLQYSKWLEDPYIMARGYLYKGYTKLLDCAELLVMSGKRKSDDKGSRNLSSTRVIDPVDKSALGGIKAHESTNIGVNPRQVEAGNQSFLKKSLGKLKEVSMDVLQGTQLLAIDSAASVIFVKRVLKGEELTKNEQKYLRRTLTDLASVVPIGVFMLLPITAVGHAAVLAAIQRYAPSLIPSVYGPERLMLMRQLQKMKELKGAVANEVANPDDMNDNPGLSLPKSCDMR